MQAALSAEKMKIKERILQQIAERKNNIPSLDELQATFAMEDHFKQSYLEEHPVAPVDEFNCESVDTDSLLAEYTVKYPNSADRLDLIRSIIAKSKGLFVFLLCFTKAQLNCQISDQWGQHVYNHGLSAYSQNIRIEQDKLVKATESMDSNEVAIAKKNIKKRQMFETMAKVSSTPKIWLQKM